MKRFTSLWLVLVVVLSMSIITCGVATSESASSLDSGMIKQSQSLDIAFSMLRKDNLLLAKYNEITGSNIEGGKLYDASQYDVQNIVKKISAGDYLIDKDTGELMLCVGSLINYGYNEENTTGLDGLFSNPLVIRKNPNGSGAYVSMMCEVDGKYVTWGGDGLQPLHLSLIIGLDHSKN